ncbi:MAG: GNAT family N-acetyltransferase [Candidatus Obscuribacterales bacterium]|nr:GNAT family N-acetyltransferase [Candidatus Obscuribacterales bacterium]
MKTQSRYERGSLTVTTFNTCSEETKELFRSWALSLRPELDGGEYGSDDNGEPLPHSAYLWVIEQNKSPQFRASSLYQTFIFLDKNNNEFVATGSIVPDDRNIAKIYEIGGRGFWGFVNVRRDLRGNGIGKIVASHMDKHVQDFVDEMGEPTDFSLFTANPIAVPIYTNLGFSFVRQIHIKEFDVTEDLYTKTYVPPECLLKKTYRPAN